MRLCACAPVRARPPTNSAHNSNITATASGHWNRSARSEAFRAESARGRTASSAVSSRLISLRRSQWANAPLLARAAAWRSPSSSRETTIWPMWSRWYFSGASLLSAGTGPPAAVPTPTANTGRSWRRSSAVASSMSPSPLSPSLSTSTARRPSSPSCSKVRAAVIERGG